MSVLLATLAGSPAAPSRALHAGPRVWLARLAEALAMTVAALGILVPLVLLELGARGPGPYAVVANPFGSEDAASLAARSDGRILRAGAWRWIVIATSDDDGFRQRLRREGAWLVLSPLSSIACAIPAKG